jgi:hypothetical protein
MCRLSTLGRKMQSFRENNLSENEAAVLKNIDVLKKKLGNLAEEFKSLSRTAKKEGMEDVASKFGNQNFAYSLYDIQKDLITFMKRRK